MASPGLWDLTRLFARIGLLSFGGPAAQLALMHRELVDRRAWLSERQYLDALSFCMLLPGPEATQLATYAGWRLHGVRGGLIAGGLFVLPGALIILALAMAYGTYGSLPLVAALFLGIKVTVVVVVIEALLKLSRKALDRAALRAVALLSFIGIFALHLPFPLIILLAGLFGFVTAQGAGAHAAALLSADHAAAPRLPRTLGLAGGWVALWLAPLAGLWLAGGGLLFEIGLFFAKLAIVTFGGAYAVLAWMTQEVVQAHGWLSTEQMIDALGLAETTPGPLILVTEFVGYMAGAAAGGVPLGLAAAALVLWVTFLPSFLFIFAGAPYIARIATRPRLAAALRGITAAVVGVILNLSLWFAAHVFFAETGTFSLGPVTLVQPVLATFDPLAAALALVAAGLLWRLDWPLPLVLALMALAGAPLALLA